MTKTPDSVNPHKINFIKLKEEIDRIKSEAYEGCENWKEPLLEPEVIIKNIVQGYIVEQEGMDLEKYGAYKYEIIVCHIPTSDYEFYIEIRSCDVDSLDRFELHGMLTNETAIAAATVITEGIMSRIVKLKCGNNSFTWERLSVV